MSVDQSGGLKMEIGVLYLLVLAELIVCSTMGFVCILAKWFWPTEISLSFTYGSPEASCNKRADTYLGRRSASLMKEFWTFLYFCDDSFQNSYGRNYPIFKYWSYALFVDLQNGFGTWAPLFVDQYS